MNPKDAPPEAPATEQEAKDQVKRETARILDLDLKDERITEKSNLPFRCAFYFDMVLEEPSATPPYKMHERRYNGVFVTKRLTIGDRNLIEITKQTIVGGMLLPPYADQLANQRSYLQYALLQYPDWWKPEQFYSGHVLDAVYEKVRALHDNFRARVLGS